MPKISYLAKAKNGKDDTEVTALQIEQKIADIEALLRGMIDEDNMLCNNDGKNTVPLSPSNVVDMPIETRPVQQCMKFFGTNTTQTDDIVKTLFENLAEKAEKNIEFRLLNSIGDKEIIFNSEAEKGIFKNIDVELPFNYVPVTWGELWEIIQRINPNIHYDSNENPVEFSDKNAFFAWFCVNETDFVVELSYNFDPCLAYYFNDGTVDFESNNFNFSLSVATLKDATSWLFRLVCSLLCKVNL